MTRDRTSRLAPSVPKGCAKDGGCDFIRTMSSCSLGAYGLTSGAATAISTRPRTKAMAASVARRERRRRSQSRIADPGIGKRDEQIRQQVADDDENPGDDHAGGGDVVVERLDGDHRQLAQPSPSEDILDEDKAAEDGWEQVSDDRDRRSQRVAQRMTADHDALGRSLCPGRPEVVAGEDVEDRGALKSGNDRGDEDRGGKRRQREMPEAIRERVPTGTVLGDQRVGGAGDGKEPETEGETHLQNQREPEVRDRVDEHAAAGDQPSPPAETTGAGEDAGSDPDDDRDRQPDDGERQRGWKRVPA